MSESAFATVEEVLHRFNEELVKNPVFCVSLPFAYSDLPVCTKLGIICKNGLIDFSGLEKWG